MDPLDLAISHAAAVHEALEAYRRVCLGGEGDEKPGRGLKRRARSLPGLILSSGLIPALTFYMSKADTQAYREYVRLLEKAERGEKGAAASLVEAAAGGGGEACRGDSVLTELSGGEGAGYSLALAMASRALQRLARVEAGGDGGFAGLAATLREGLGSPEKEAAATQLLIDYLQEVKKLVEAIVKE
ncbi:type III-B CRISPR module-associated protein Cmr5 [Aeropyrum pernix]|uniref:CRISPR type III-B/RAMP module-associated protein Cmr5 n=1 Tax=Aeropyrum pernix TaxID=56636 RepID=A0A401H9X0_AERPX|nr:type III-B CRISPR module-associated protein Cmr5 [Aeropyrum pernix]GBF09152.1 type III-B CRISPR module-associated protein Cmr5 [Aeropyrum pernix]